MNKISAEELFDIWHLQSNCIDIEIHSMENGDVKLANNMRKIRHRLNEIIFDEMSNPQYLCTYKHLLSARMELMELMEKWGERGNEKLVKFAKEKIDELSESMLNIISKIRKKKLDIKT